MRPFDDSRDSYLHDSPKHRSLTFHPIPDAQGRPASPPRTLGTEERSRGQAKETLFYAVAFAIAVFCAYKLGTGKRIASEPISGKSSITVKS